MPLELPPLELLLELPPEPLLELPLEVPEDEATPLLLLELPVELPLETPEDELLLPLDELPPDELLPLDEPPVPDEPPFDEPPIPEELPPPSATAGASPPSPPPDPSTTVASAPASPPASPATVPSPLPASTYSSPATYVGSNDTSTSLDPHKPVSGWQLSPSAHVDCGSPSEPTSVTCPMHTRANTKRISATRSVGTRTCASRCATGCPNASNAVTRMSASWSGLLPAAIANVVGRFIS
jgi:hypothetical protein